MPAHKKTSRVGAAVLFLAALAPAQALAQPPPPAQVSDADKATARELARDGYAALERKDYAAAADRFARADALFPAPTVAVGLARARLALGKMVSAHELYSRVAHETIPPNAPQVFVQAVEEAQRELEALERRLPVLVIDVKGPSAPVVTVDGAVVPVAALGARRPVDPGEHVVKVAAPGFAPVSRSVVLGEGESLPLTFELQPDGSPQAPPDATQAQAPGPRPGPVGDAGGGGSLRRTLGFVSLGVGGVALIAGGVAGALAVARHADIAASCPGGICPLSEQSSLQPKIDGYDTAGAAATIGLVAGVVFAATGVVLVVTAPRAPAVALSPVVAPGFAGLQGRF